MTSTPSPPPAGPWVWQWLSVPRYRVYLAAADGDAGQALALYEWNSQLSAAFHRDLAHLEIALRNAYDTALAAYSPDRHTGHLLGPRCSRRSTGPVAAAVSM